MSYGDASRGGMAMSRYYNPYYDPRAAGGGMAAFMIRQPAEVPQQSGQYYLPDRRRQTQQEPNFITPQQNEVYYPQQPENPIVPTEATELADPTEKAEVIPTTVKAIAVPELVEPEVEQIPEDEPVPKPKKAVNKKKQVKRPVDDEDDEEGNAPRMPAAAFFPMFFGWGGGRSGAGGSAGPTAIANAYSTGRGGVATSHATAYGAPRPEERA